MRSAAAALLIMIAAPAWGAEVLFCADREAIGFSWEGGIAKGQRTTFANETFVVRVLSESTREITATVGPRQGWKRVFACSRPLAHWSDSANETTRRLSRQIACDMNRVEQWTFHDGTYVRVGIGGYPAGDPPDTPYDSYSFVAYGSCAKD